MNAGIILFILTAISLLLTRFVRRKDRYSIDYGYKRPSYEKPRTYKPDKDAGQGVQSAVSGGDLNQVGSARRDQKIAIDSHGTSQAIVAHAASPREPNNLISRSTVRVWISFAVLGASLYIILKDSYSLSSQKWAFGSVGTILGYWLKD